MEKRISTDELWTILRHGGSEFFSVEFERRKPSEDGRIPAGTIRKMLCRTGMQKYKQGVESEAARDARDFQHCILTVWDFQAFLANRKRGMAEFAAGARAWRTIDIVSVKKVSLLENEDLPPDIIAGVHQITNEFRMANMPRVAI